MTAPDNDASDVPALTEQEDGITRMTYDDGKWHWFPVIIWLGVITGIVIYAARLLIPSLSNWGAP